MANIAIAGSSTGTATYTIQSPSGSTDRVLTLPDATGELDRLNRAGNVLQVVSATKSNSFSTSSTSAVDVTDLSVSITPSSTSSKILVMTQLFCGSDLNSAFYANLVRNSTALNVGTAGSGFNSTVGSYAGSANFYGTIPIMFLDSPSTTSSTTYKIQIFASTGTGTVVINRRVTDVVIGGSSTITVMEIAG